MMEVNCQTHGPRKAAFVCNHAVMTLVDGIPRGFFRTSAQDDEPCGWCSDCHERYVAAGEEWTGEAEKKLDAKLLCIDCFGSLIKINGLQ